MVGYRSGQTEQTVNLLANAFGGSNPPPTIQEKQPRIRTESSSIERDLLVQVKEAGIHGEAEV